jgi:hypothetical protein
MDGGGPSDPDADELVVAVREMSDALGIDRDVMLRAMTLQVRKIATFEELRRLHDARWN